MVLTTLGASEHSGWRSPVAHSLIVQDARVCWQFVSNAGSRAGGFAGLRHFGWVLSDNT